MNLVTHFLLGAVLSVAVSVGRGGEARPVPFETGREEVRFEKKGVISLGAGPAVRIALQGDLLAVATNRRGGSGGRTPWYSADAVDVYRLTDDGPEHVVSVPVGSTVRVLQFDRPNQLFVGDQTYLSLYSIYPDKGAYRRQWTYAVSELDQIVPIYLHYILRTGDRALTLATNGNLRRAGFLPSRWMTWGGIHDRYVTIHPQGGCELYCQDTTRRFRYIRGLALLGDAVKIEHLAGDRVLVLDRDRGLRVFKTTHLIKDLRKNARKVRESLTEASYGLYIAGECEFADEAIDFDVGDGFIAVLDRTGKVWTVPLEPGSGRLGEPVCVPDLKNVVSLAADGSRVAAIAGGGRVYAFGPKTPVTEVIVPVQVGPWFPVDDTPCVAIDGSVYVLSESGLGSRVFEGSGPIVDARAAGGRVFLLKGGALLCAEWRDQRLVAVGEVEVPGNAELLRVGPTHAAVVHGHNGLCLVDIRRPEEMRVVADRELDLQPFGDVSAQKRIQDLVVEEDRLLVTGPEVYVYGQEALLSDAPTVEPKAVWNRPYMSGDEWMSPSLLRGLGPGRYLFTSRAGVDTRAYVLTETDGNTFNWRYTQLGLGNVQDLASAGEGLYLAACAADGVRAVRVDGAGGMSLLGSGREPGCEYQAVLAVGDTVYVRSGNSVITYGLSVRPTTERTAFAYEPAGDEMPTVTVDGVDVTSEAYRASMSYRNKLKLVRADLSDQAGFPGVAVPQGTVAVDPQTGRIKFADARNGEPRFLARSEYMNVGFAGMRKAGRYHIAAMSEQSQGFGVLDLSDPTCMEIVGVAGQAPYYAYPHTVIARRDGYAYIAGNMGARVVQPVDFRDPHHPHYERAVDRKAGGVMKFTCGTRYSGFFRDDRLFVPCSEGLTEIDVSNPEHIERVAVHEPSRLIHQVFPEQNRAARWLDGRLEFLDITDVSAPKVIGRYPAEGPFERPWGLTITDGDRTYIRAPNANNRGWQLTLLDTADWRNPRFIGTFEVPDGADGKPDRYNGAFEVRDGIVYLPGHWRFFVLDWRDAENPRLVGSLDEDAFVGTWRYRYMEQQPRVTVVAGDQFGRGMIVEAIDGNTVWLYGMEATYAVDVADPAKPKIVGGGPGFGESYWIRSDESDLVMIGGYRHSFYDIADPLRPRCIMERWDGSPHETGFPASGHRMPRLEASSSAIRRWEHNPETGLFDVVDSGLRPFWLARDVVLNGRDYCHIIAGQRGNNSTTLRTGPVAVEPGERLRLQALVRTDSYPDRLHMFDRSHLYDNARASFVRLWLCPAGSDRPIWRDERDESDGVLYSIDQSIVVPADVSAVELRAIVAGDVCLGDIALRRDGSNLIENGDLRTDKDGNPPGWHIDPVYGAKRDHNNFAADFCDGETFYMLHRNELFLYDLASQKRFPVARIAVQVDAKSDSPVVTKVRREGDRKIAYVATYQGLLSVDVTDPYRPARLGTLTLPWLDGSQHDADFSGDFLVVSQGYTSNPFTHGFCVVDISNPARMRLRSAVQHKRHSGTVCHNGYVILGDYGQGMQIWDITNPDRPELVIDQGYDRCSQTRTIGYHGNHVLRNEVGGLETWETPIRAQAPSGKVEVR